MTRMPNATASHRLLAVTMLCIITVASAGRLIDLRHLLVWHDEVFTLVRVFGYEQGDVYRAIFSGELLSPAQLLRFQQPNPAHGWSETLDALMQHPEHSPLYYVAGWLATGLPLDPVTALRGTSALFGLLLPVAAYWLMRELFGRGPIPWVAAALVACSPMQILYAQEARQYALWVLMVVAASAALERALRQDRRGDWWLYGGFVTLGLYSHLLFALMLPVHAAYGWLSGAHASGRLTRPAPLPIRHWLTAAGVSLLLFLPWIWVILTQTDRVGRYTAWMTRPSGLGELFTAWGKHLIRTYVDLRPTDPALVWFLLLPLVGWAIWRYLRHAPRPALWLLPLTAAAYVGIVLGPDLLLGGVHSQHVRYGLPGMLAMQLMVAWTLGAALSAASLPTRRLAGLALALLIGLGAVSFVQIQRADTWWTKQFSAHNAQIARQVNATGHPVVLASNDAASVGVGELISLAYHLDDRVRIWGEPGGEQCRPPEGLDDAILLTPSARLLEAIGSEGWPPRIPGTWQWRRAEGVDTGVQRPASTPKGPPS